MGNQDYRRALYLKDDFMNGVLPNVNFKGCRGEFKVSCSTLRRWGIYLKAVENLDVWFTGKYIDVPATIEGGMKIDRLIRMPYSGIFQELLLLMCYMIGCFIFRMRMIWNTRSLGGDANAITEVFTESVSGITLALNDLKDMTFFIVVLTWEKLSRNQGTQEYGRCVYALQG